MRIYVKPGAQCPQYATSGSAAFDLQANLPKAVNLGPGETMLIPCGIHVEIPRGFVGLVCSRSGLARKKGVFVLNSPGVIDSDYRGEVGAILFNANHDMCGFNVEHGDRIAQMLIVPVAEVVFDTVGSLEELSSTARGSSGFGSTGV